MSMNCQLTDRGREAVEEIAEMVEGGGSYTDFRKLQDTTAFKYVGRGNHRVVYYGGVQAGETDGEPVVEGGDCVVKISQYPDPWPNKNEILNWKFAPPEVRDLLVPVEEYSDTGHWLMMPRVDAGVQEEEAERVEQQFLEAGIQLGDLRRENMGYYNGEPRVLDYGFRMKRNAVDLPDEYRDGKPEQIGPRESDFFGPGG